MDGTPDPTATLAMMSPVREGDGWSDEGDRVPVLSSSPDQSPRDDDAEMLENGLDVIDEDNDYDDEDDDDDLDLINTQRQIYGLSELFDVDRSVRRSKKKKKVFSEDDRKSLAFRTYMYEKVQALPFPEAIKNYLSYFRTKPEQAPDLKTEKKGDQSQSASSMASSDEDDNNDEETKYI